VGSAGIYQCTRMKLKTNPGDSSNDIRVYRSHTTRLMLTH
jgi:hypothetical protein